MRNIVFLAAALAMTAIAFSAGPASACEDPRPCSTPTPAAADAAPAAATEVPATATGKPLRLGTFLKPAAKQSGHRQSTNRQSAKRHYAKAPSKHHAHVAKAKPQAPSHDDVAAQGAAALEAAALEARAKQPDPNASGVQVVSPDEVNVIDRNADAVAVVAADDYNAIDVAAGTATAASADMDADTVDVPKASAPPAGPAVAPASDAAQPAVPAPQAASADQQASAAQTPGPDNTSPWFKRIAVMLGGALAAASALRMFVA